MQFWNIFVYKIFYFPLNRFLAFIIQVALGIAFFSTDMLYVKVQENGQDVNFAEAEKIFR